MVGVGPQISLPANDGRAPDGDRELVMAEVSIKTGEEPLRALGGPPFWSKARQFGIVSKLKSLGEKTD